MVLLLLRGLIKKAIRKPVQQPGKRGGKFYFTKEGQKVRYGSRQAFFVDKKQNLRFGVTKKLTPEELNQKRQAGLPRRHASSGIGEKVTKQDLKTIKRNIEHGAKNFKTVHIAYTTKDGSVKLVHNAEPKSYRGSGKSALFYFINPNGLDVSTNTRGRVLRSFLLQNVLAVLPGSKNYQDDPKFPVEIGQSVKKAVTIKRNVPSKEFPGRSMTVREIRGKDGSKFRVTRYSKLSSPRYGGSVPMTTYAVSRNSGVRLKTIPDTHGHDYARNFGRGLYQTRFPKKVVKGNQGKLVYSTNFNNIVGMAKQRGMSIRDILKKVGPRIHKDRRAYVLKVGRAFGLTDRDAIRTGKKVGTIN